MGEDLMFYNAKEIKTYIAENHEKCPKRTIGSIDLLIFLKNTDPEGFANALWKLELSDEACMTGLEAIHTDHINSLTPEDILNDYTYTTELYNSFDQLDDLINAQEEEVDMTQILQFFLRHSETSAGLFLNKAKEGVVLDEFNKEVRAFIDRASGDEGAGDNKVRIDYSHSTDVAPYAAPQAAPSAESEKEEGIDPTEFLVDMLAQAKDTPYDAVIGRADETAAMVQILLRKEKRNPLIVGEAGVGKTAIVHALVQKMVDGDVPKDIALKPVFSLDVATLLAGTSLRGQFEERLKAVLDYAQEQDAILFIDEMHTVMEEGEMADMLKPYLSHPSKPISVIGATTYQESKAIMKDSAMARRMGKVTVNEPSAELAIEMVQGKREQYQNFHAGIQLDDSAIIAAVEETSRHMHESFLPDKAFSIIDSAMATRRAGLVPEGCDADLITERDIYAQLSRDLGREIGPIESPAVKAKLMGLKACFNAAVINQEEAIDALSKRVRNSGSNLFASTRKSKTLGSFMFAGPTGVGKTELTRQLAKEMGIPLLKYDMSEFSDKSSVKRLTGADPSYIGYENGGQLVNDIRQNPSCVLLLDEIEKADPSIFKLLLQILDDAVLTDGQGKKANFQNVYVVMTTNAGANIKEIRSIGFKPETKTVENQKLKLIKDLFSEEFVGRLDGVIDFNDITDMDDVLKILDIYLQPQLDDLAAKDITVDFKQEAKTFIAQKCLDAKLGVRPLKIALETYFQSPLVDAFCSEALKAGDDVVINGPLNDNTDALNVQFEGPKLKRLAAPVVK
jgi:ATP-dependent Clp protease ATP-binding subunit ClpA